MSERDPMLPEACAAARTELGALLDGELDAAARESVDRHLAGCAACRAELALLRAVTRAVQALPRPAPPEAMRYRLQARIQAETAPHHQELQIVDQQGDRWSRWRMARAAVEEPRRSRGRRVAAEEPGGSVFQCWTQSGDRSTFYRYVRTEAG
jgi:anti-sigma factor RsiW